MCVAGWGVVGSLSGSCYSAAVASDRVRYECSVCSRTFSNVYNLKVHVRDQHSGLGAITCDICGVHLKNLSTLRVHKSNYHPKCNVCGEHLKNAAALAYHKLAVHHHKALNGSSSSAVGMDEFNTSSYKSSSSSESQLQQSLSNAHHGYKS